MDSEPPWGLQNQDYYVNEYREFKKGFGNQRRLRTDDDPMFLIGTLVMLFVAIGRALFDIARWLVRKAPRKR